MGKRKKQKKQDIVFKIISLSILLVIILLGSKISNSKENNKENVLQSNGNDLTVYFIDVG